MTPEQRDSAAKILLGLPAIIQQNTDSIAALQEVKASFLEADGVNESFQDIFIDNLEKYHQELLRYTGDTYSSYDTAQIDPAARQATGNVHYPDGWDPVLPKITDDVNGLPISNDPLYLTETVLRDLLSGSYNSSPVTQSVSTSGNTATVTFLSGGSFPGNVGDVVGIRNTGDGDYSAVRVDSLGSTTSTSAQFDFTLLAGDLPVTGICQVGLVEEEYEVLATEVRDHYLATKAIIDSISDPDAGSLNTTASTTLANYITVINNWLASGTRFDSAEITALEASFTAREMAVQARIPEVELLLGSVTQDSEGVASGDGSNFKAWQWVVARISKAGGTLYSFYETGLAEEYIDRQKDNNQFLLDQYSAEITAVSILASDVEAGSTQISLVDATDFTTGTYTLSSDAGLRETVTVLAKVGNDLSLSSPITNSYEVNQFARLYS